MIGQWKREEKGKKDIGTGGRKKKHWPAMFFSTVKYQIEL